MYAIISDGGRQYRVEQGQELQVDYREAHEGDQITFDKVLAVSGDGDMRLGRPLLDGAAVQAEVLGVGQAPKIFVQKLRRRKNSRRRTGHRQLYTRVRIGSITAG